MIDSDDMECCTGTEKQPHPPVWFYRPEQWQWDGEVHTNLGRVGNCPVCVVLKHVVPRTDGIWKKSWLEVKT